MISSKGQKGAALVEFAVLSTLLLVFLFGIFEFGFLWLNSFYIANSAREGARVAAKIHGNEAADTIARENAAASAVDDYLAEFPLFASRLEEAGFISVAYQDDSLTMTVDGESLTVPITRVTVTVETARVWEPILWPLLSALIPGGANLELREITQTASYAIE